MEPVLLTAREPRRKGLPSLKARAARLRARGAVPLLKVVLVGDDPASVLYTGKKKAYMESFGAACDIIRLPADAQAAELLGVVDDVARDPLVHGALTQLPLPAHLAGLGAESRFPARMDVDGLCAENVRGLVRGDDEGRIMVPCTPKGVALLLAHHGIPVAGRRAAVVGRSMIAGKPMAALLTNLDATVTLCHSRTRDLAGETRRADVIVSAVGRPGLIRKEHIGDNRPAVVDVGTTPLPGGGVAGDVAFDEVAPLAGAIAPVPGGAGPMTVHCLALNLLQAAERATAAGDGGRRT